jgi:protein-L-isoaspartate(D-aspartate) O-methyltransferase
MKSINEKHFAIFRQHMVDVIGIHTDLVEEELGKAALAEPVLKAMLGIPRHLFVPPALAHLAYHVTIRHFRSGSKRRSPSPSCVP